MPTFKDSRCSVSIPFGATGEDSELCGTLTNQVCENCGTICNSCAETFPCPLIPDGKHSFQANHPTPTDNPKPIIIKGCSGGPEGKWDEVQAIQHQPFIYVSYNGSEWVWEGKDDVAVLLDMLAHYRLSEHDRGSDCYTVDPCYGVENPKWDRWNRESNEERYIDGPRLYACDGVVRFSGNFEHYAHAFGIDTNHKPTIKALMAAIAKNDQVVEDGGGWMAQQYRAAAEQAEGGAA